MSSPVEKIKEKLSILDIVGSYMKIEKSGSNFKGKCPFHNEKTPSFFVSPDRGTYYCFGCGAKGDIFTFVEEFEGLDFSGALKMLAGRAGVPLVYEKPEVKNEKEKLLQLLEEITLFFQRSLISNKEAMKYLHERGLKSETMKEWRVGFAPNEWRAGYEYLKVRGWSDLEIEKAGLIKRADRGPASSTDKEKISGEEVRLYDRFRSRIMFPISDSSGRVIAFSGRIFGTEDENTPKYLNSPDTPLFNKSHIFYGMDKAKYEIRKKGFAVLVEGQMDLLMSHQAGIKNAVAVSGTALTDDLVNNNDVVTHFGMIKRLADTLVLAFDSDSAGFKATERSVRIALSIGMDVKIVTILSGKDPADLIKENSKLWEKAVNEAEPIIDFLLKKISSEKIGPSKAEVSKDLRIAIENQVLPFISALDSEIEKAKYVSKSALILGVRENAIWEELKKEKYQAIGLKEDFKLNKTDKVKQNKAIISKDPLYRRMAGLIFWKEKNEHPPSQSINFKQRLSKILGEKGFKEFEKTYEGIKSELIFEAEAVYEGSKNAEEEIEQLFGYIEEDYLKNEFSQAMAELARAENEKDKNLVEKLLKRCKELSENISKIKNKRNKL